MKNKSSGIKCLLISICCILVSTIIVSKKTYAQEAESQIGLLPDWSKISFSDLDPVAEGGSIPDSLDQEVGWKISRVWEAGDLVVNILKLGDLKETLAPQLFSLEDIYRRVNKLPPEVEETLPENYSYIPEEVSLEDLPLIGDQTVSDLIEAVPELGEMRGDQIEPIRDLLVKNGYGESGEDLESLAKEPEIGDLRLDELDLSTYSHNSIPYASQAQIKEFEGYEEQTVSEIPGLDQLALSDYPNSITSETAFIGRIDFIKGEAEANRNNTISGSKIEGFNVSCDENCAHLELDDIENLGRGLALPFEGTQWIRGRDHWVLGGTGCFAGQREPTGIHPFGDTFKAVLWETDETTDTAEVMMYFNIKTQCGESPYYIGPFPYPMGFVNVNDWIYLGTGQ